MPQVVHAAFGLLSLGLTVLGIFVTATIIGGSSAAGGGDGGGRMSLYGGEAYLNELRNVEHLVLRP